MILKVEVYAVVLALSQSWNWTAGTRTDLAIYSDITPVKTCKIFLYQMHTELKNNHNEPSFRELNTKILIFLLAFSVSQGQKFFPSLSISLRRVNLNLVYTIMDQTPMKLEH